MSWMQTYSGLRFYPEKVKNSGFCIEDIAHALSNLCRFGGHTNAFYSVAQHSLLVADIVKANGGSLEEELWALMHDSTEAYMVDVPTPVKVTLTGYKEKEQEVLVAIQKALKLPKLVNGELPKIIKQADGIALVTEARQLVNGDVSEWDACKIHQPLKVKIKSMAPREAKEQFLVRWSHLIQAITKVNT